MQGDWTAWCDGWPDWRDTGRRVGVRYPTSEVEGVLRADTGFDGENEYPIFTVVDDAGAEHSFASCDEWRFL